MIKPLLFAASLLTLSGAALTAHADPLLGTWNAVDNRTGFHVADMVIRKDPKTKVYSATVSRLLPLPGGTATVNTHCVKCQGEYKDTPVIGMEALQGLTMAEPSELVNGTWISPTDGRHYQMTGSVNNSNTFISLKGRTEGSTLTMTWRKKQSS